MSQKLIPSVDKRLDYTRMRSREYIVLIFIEYIGILRRGIIKDRFQNDKHYVNAL